MQNLFTKNAVVGIALLIGGSTTAFVSVQGWRLYQKSTHVRAKHDAAKKTAQIEGGPALKSDDKIQACYQDFLKKEPATDEGFVRFHLTIKTTGEIDRLDLVETELQDPDFTDCLSKEIRTLRVLVTPERLNVVINHRFNFKRRTPASVEF